MNFINKTPLNAAPFVLMDRTGEETLLPVVKGTWSIGKDGKLTLADKQIPAGMIRQLTNSVWKTLWDGELWLLSQISTLIVYCCRISKIPPTLSKNRASDPSRSDSG